MTPEQEDEVRRVLAGFGGPEPTPPQVSARLDATLARLVEERATDQAADQTHAQTHDEATDELAVRRSRRWRGALVAAASVAVLGTGVGVVVNGTGTSGGDSMTTALDTAGEEAGGRDLAPGLSSDDAGGPESAEVGVEALRDLRGTELSSDTLGQDVRRAARLLAGPSMEKAAEPEPWMIDCALPDASAGDRLAAVRLDGDRATLVLRAPVEGTHVAEIYSCDGLDLVAVRKVPVPRESP